MVIVQLTGGLGNQLFQYAMGRTIAARHRTILKLDVTFFETYEWHEYSLAPFNISAEIATKEEIAALKAKNYALSERLKRKLFRSLPVIVIEQGLHYNSLYSTAGSNSYLQGYWQSEKYFQTQKTLIKKEFQIVPPPSPRNLEIIREIKSYKNSVSLHIRRGNFASVEAVNKVHGTTSLQYYEDAVKFLEKKFQTVVFFIFSDDINWAKENLRLKSRGVFVDVNDSKTDYEDLRLMYTCNHNILANSTFSWWGAWLNDNATKTVIAPEQWFADKEKNSAASSILPQNWIRL